MRSLILDEDSLVPKYARLGIPAVSSSEIIRKIMTTAIMIIFYFNQMRVEVIGDKVPQPPVFLSRHDL